MIEAVTLPNRPSTNLNLAIVGNCGYAALLDEMARLVWMCLPRIDGDPVFCSLLADGNDDSRGGFNVEIVNFERSEQRYQHNSAILVTTLHDQNGGAVEITDFAPRYREDGNYFRPLNLVRHVVPVAGRPRVRISVRPTYNYGAAEPETTIGANYIRYLIPGMALRLTTNGPISYISRAQPFLLERPVSMIMGPDEPIPGAIDDIARVYYERTRHYWREWTRYLSIPFEWQREVIRSAVTLKLCSIEETGAIVAAVTTSIPESENSSRNWDYRYCWLRDAYFVVNVLNKLGATRTLEDYLYYINNLIETLSDGDLQPVYGVMGEADLTERVIESLAGFRGMGPVRVGNNAFSQVQNDTYGAVIMALTHVFFDQRLESPGTPALFARLERLGEKAVASFGKPDSGIWEKRGAQEAHTFSAVMCWGAADNLCKIAAHLELSDRVDYWHRHADRMRAEILEKAFDTNHNCFVSSFGGSDIDASLLLLHQIGFIEPEDPKFVGTVDAVSRLLRRGQHVFRYVSEDDFGVPMNAFNICTFWYIDALAATGQIEEARELFEVMLSHTNHIGLLSEDISVETGDLWGNFPQTYSMVGLINSAMRISRRWDEAY